MIRKLFVFFALAAVVALGTVAVRALSAQGHGGRMGMMKDRPMMGRMHGQGGTHGGMMGGHHGMEQED